MPVGNELKRLKAEYPDLDIETIDAMMHPIRAWKDGIRLFPAIKIGDDVLSGFFLTGDQLRRFVEDHLQGKKSS